MSTASSETSSSLLDGLHNGDRDAARVLLGYIQAAGETIRLRINPLYEKEERVVAVGSEADLAAQLGRLKPKDQEVVLGSLTRMVRQRLGNAVGSSR